MREVLVTEGEGAGSMYPWGADNEEATSVAKIVLGFGSSHGPTMRTQPAEWDKLAERDKKDPRYDYAELLRNASPSLADEITPEKKQTRFDDTQVAIGKVAEVVKKAAPDVVIVISNQHSVLIDDQLPVM